MYKFLLDSVYRFIIVINYILVSSRSPPEIPFDFTSISSHPFPFLCPLCARSLPLLSGPHQPEHCWGCCCWAGQPLIRTMMNYYYYSSKNKILFVDQKSIIAIHSNFLSFALLSGTRTRYNNLEYLQRRFIMGVVL